ncbi:MAG: hypothetical protein JO165_12940 [Candidatus Eremiobacteraeota bacterium]|nr:hypothetical protein [Candidatus Eremiobacteraeota bacterium]
MFVAPRFTGVLGLDVDPDGTIAYVQHGMPGSRAGLHVGDKALPLHGTFSEKVAQRWDVSGVPVRIDVLRGNRHLTLLIVPDPWKPGLRVWLELAGSFWMIGFAVIIALYAKSRLALLLSSFLVAQGIATLLTDRGFGGFMSPWPWLNETAALLGPPVNALANGLFATVASSFSLPLSRQRRWLEIATYALAFVSASIGISLEFSIVGGWGTTGSGFPLLAPAYWWSNYATCVLAVATASMALISVHGDERQRARWLLWPMITLFGISLFSSLLSLRITGFWAGGQFVTIVTDLATFIVPAMLTYAVLTHRLVDINFVLNRAAVFATVSFIVIGVFVLTEWLLTRLFADASRTTSVLISLAIALSLGISLNYIHRHVDRIIDQVLFRTRHEHERSLRAFAREAPFITDYDTLLDYTMREVSANAESESVAILLKDDHGTYSTVRCTNGAVDHVTENDRAVLKMRTWHTLVHLDDIDTALHGAWAYPLMSRGALMGILVCGPKRGGEGYAPDEAEALAYVAQAVGSALGTLPSANANSSTAIDDLRAGIAEIRDTLRMLVGENRRL